MKQGRHLYLTIRQTHSFVQFYMFYRAQFMFELKYYKFKAIQTKQPDDRSYWMRTKAAEDFFHSLLNIILIQGVHPNVHSTHLL